MKYNVSTKTKGKRVEINADHASVNEQAGIYAGDEGYGY